jgi:hypothetical protein
VSEVWSKASVGLFGTLVARLDTQLLLYVKFVPVVVDPVFCCWRKGCIEPPVPVQLLPCFGRLRETRRRKLDFGEVTHTPARSVGPQISSARRFVHSTRYSIKYVMSHYLVHLPFSLPYLYSREYVDEGSMGTDNHKTVYFGLSDPLNLFL